MRLYCGIDLHSNNSVISVIDDEAVLSAKTCQVAGDGGEKGIGEQASPSGVSHVEAPTAFRYRQGFRLSGRGDVGTA